MAKIFLQEHSSECTPQMLDLGPVTDLGQNFPGGGRYSTGEDCKWNSQAMLCHSVARRHGQERIYLDRNRETHGFQHSS